MKYPIQDRFRIAKSDFISEIISGIEIELKFGGMPISENEWLFISRENDLMENPIQFIELGAFINVSLVAEDLFFVNEVVLTKNYLEYLKTKNYFTHITDHLDHLGIGQQVNQLKVGEQFMGVVECCVCGYPDCASQKAWIIKKKDGFIIPFFYDYGEILPCIDLIQRFGDYDTNEPILLNDYSIELDDNGHVLKWYDEDGYDRIYPFWGKISDYKIENNEYFPKRKWRPYIP